jgi:hypothetical protein
MRTYFIHRHRPLSKPAIPTREPLTYIKDMQPSATSVLQLVARMQRIGWLTVDKDYEGAHGRGWLMANHVEAALLEEHGPCDWRFRVLPMAGVNGKERISYNPIYCLCIPENRPSKTSKTFNR